MFSIDGLVSGLDTSKIIEGLLSIQQGQLDRMELQKQDVVVRQSAFQGIEANTVALQSAARQLASTSNDVFSVFTATVSDETMLQAAADATAATGTYQLKVTQLAKAAQNASQSFASAESELTLGDISFQVGNRDVTTISITADNNSLQGLVDSINAATSDVSATVINDGSGYRMLLTSQHTGADNPISIVNSTGPDSGDAIQIDMSGAPVQDAADSIIQLGSGAGAISIQRSTNTVDDVIQGLTLNLLDADASKEITVSLERETESAKTAIEGFVGAFNSLMTYIDEQTAYNVDTEEAGLLLGDSSTNGIRNQLRNTLARTIGNLESEANRLSAIGISFNDTGKLQIDSTTLDKALAGKLEGVDAQDVGRIFSLDGQSDNSNITFLAGSNDTASSDTTWEVNVTLASERASITSSGTIGASVVIDGTNDSLTVEVDGTDSGPLTLTHGTYNQADLAEHVQSVINQASTLGPRDVTVTVDNNEMVIQSAVYGTRSEIGDVTGTAAVEFGFTGSEYDRGRDVAGYFIVDGETETATGSGRVLSADKDNENTSGLQVKVTLTSSQISGVHTSDLTVTRGFASQLDVMIDDLLDSETGRFATSNNSYNDQIDSIDTSVERMNVLFESKQQQLVNQFVAIESSISSLQTTSAFLASQLGAASLLASN